MCSSDLDEEHVPTVFNGSLADVQKLFFSGQLKIGGNVMASNKLIVLQNMDKKLIDQARDARVASGNTTQAVAAPTSAAKVAKAPEIFTALQNRLKGESNANHTYQFNITEPNESWTVNLANGMDAFAQPEKVAHGKQAVRRKEIEERHHAAASFFFPGYGSSRELSRCFLSSLSRAVFPPRRYGRFPDRKSVV